MLSTVLGLEQCTNYSIEIGAGPYIYRQDEVQNIASFQVTEAEVSLLKIINNIWSSQESSFKSFGSTIPVSLKFIKLIFYDIIKILFPSRFM